MSRRKNDAPNGQLHPQRSFQDIVADATLAKFGDYINQRVREEGQALMQRQVQALQNLFIRIVALEEIVMECNPSVTKDTLADKVAAIQDRNDGYDTVVDSDNKETVVQSGDRVRLEIKTKTADQAEYQGSARLLVDDVGSGRTLGAELEKAILGMSAQETKEAKFGKDESMVASLFVNMISRKIVEKSVETSTPNTEETPNVSANAG